MSVKERDPLTGHETTGHEWDGITELNTRVPRAVWFFIIVTHVWALIYWVLMPAWPMVNNYTRGVLGYDQQEVVTEQLLVAKAERAGWVSQIDRMSVEEIGADPALMIRVNQTAPMLFGDNCAGCHGRDAAGGAGFPSLTDDAWLWGGDAGAIMETLRVGINAPHPETRLSQMLGFGEMGMLDRNQVRVVADYVQSLSGLKHNASPERLAEGEGLFAENCTSCHGETGQGMADLGAPNLTDAAWIYGSDDAALFKTIHDGRQGWMPAWEDRLSLADRKMLTLYIQSRQEEESK